MKQLGVVLLLLLSLHARADEKFTQIVIWTSSSEYVAYQIADMPRIVFEENDICIETTKTKVYYPKDKSIRITFLRGNESSISDAKAAAVCRMTEDKILITDIACGQEVDLLAADGKALGRKNADADGSVVFATAGLQSGIYIVKVGDVVFKFLKK